MVKFYEGIEDPDASGGAWARFRQVMAGVGVACGVAGLVTLRNIMANS